MARACRDETRHDRGVERAARRDTLLTRCVQCGLRCRHTILLRDAEGARTLRVHVDSLYAEQRERGGGEPAFTCPEER